MALRKEAEADPQEPGREKLPPGHKLLLAGPASLVAFGLGTKEGSTGPLPRFQPNQQAVERLFAEYQSIFDLLVRILGRERILVIKTKLILGKNSPDGAIQFQSRELPEELAFGSTEIPYLSDFFASWPRDAHTLVDGQILANSQAWRIQGERIQPSLLGEGGKVLLKGKAILVTPDIWRTARRGEIPSLRNRGFRVGCLPFVDPSKQQFEFKEDHVDGHASLIEDKTGKLILVVAESYSRQGAGTRKLIRQAANSVEAELVEVYDKNLPPLAFNFIQFDDMTIALGSAEAKDLELTLGILVGPDRVLTTEDPLRLIPSVAFGGIRCLTNVIPPLSDLEISGGQA